MSKIILKNKRTKEKLELSEIEFKKKFAKEIQNAYESFRQTLLNKRLYLQKDEKSIEFDFYYELQWNFNNFSNSAWYIEKLSK